MITHLRKIRVVVRMVIILSMMMVMNQKKNMNIGLRMEKQLLAAILEKKSRYQFQNIWMEHW